MPGNGFSNGLWNLRRKGSKELKGVKSGHDLSELKKYWRDIPSNRTSTWNKILRELKGEMDISTIIVGDFNTHNNLNNG